MRELRLSWLALLVAAAVYLIWSIPMTATDEPTFSKEQIKQFLLHAKVVNSQESKKGVTHTSRLTLSDGTFTHDASFLLSTSTKPYRRLQTVGAKLTLLTLTSTILPLMRWRS